jgi:CPA2 family monovalent cation:H+ antiporter-2
MALLAAFLGFSAGTGAFLMGLVIVGKRADFVYVKVRPVRDLFLVIFFVTMGILLDVSELFNIFALLVVVATAFFAKYLGAYLGSFLVGEKQRAPDVAIGMVPRGEFNLILAREAATFGVASAALYSIAGMTVLGTTLLSSLVQLVRQRKRRPR